MPRFIAALTECAEAVDTRLTELIAAETARGAPDRLGDAMRHAVLAGGKRFRPFLLMETARLFGVEPKQSVEVAAAIECIHCYSLVHDDLPAMDNDELRRGQPTVWKAFGEATAILVGDALQSLAFERLAGTAAHANPSVRTELITTLAVAAGAPGMVGGQMLDLSAADGAAQNGAEAIARLQAMKTGALIRAACEMGAILGEAAPKARIALFQYGEALGYAFQISDDLLDAEGSATTVGKATGKDAAAGKATLVSLLGIEHARTTLHATVDRALDALAIFGDNADRLRSAAHFMAHRES